MTGQGKGWENGCNGEPLVFKHYKVMVKILQDNKVSYQNLEIFTTGLAQLLEMRRIHNRTFGETAAAGLIETSRRN